MALPGLNRSFVSRGGRVLLYVYAWRGKGAPLIGRYEGSNRSEAEIACEADAGGLAGRYADCVGRSAPDARFMSGLVRTFKDAVTADEIVLSENTRVLWFRYMDEIIETFGETSLRALQAKGARALIRDWYHSMSDTPGKADVCLTVMSRLFTFAIDRELMERNPIIGLRRLSASDNRGRAHLIWTREQFDGLVATCNDAQSRALELVWCTGLRRSDLVKLSWADIHWDERVIITRTKKGRRYGRKASIPIDAAVERALDAFPKDSPLVVTNSLGRPYKDEESFGKSIEKKIHKAGLSPLTLHDIRGTYVTRLFAIGTSDEDAEYIMGWAPGQGRKMRGVYGDPDALGKAAAKRWMAKQASQ